MGRIPKRKVRRTTLRQRSRSFTFPVRSYYDDRIKKQTALEPVEDNAVADSKRSGDMDSKSLSLPGRSVTPRPRGHDRGKPEKYPKDLW